MKKVMFQGILACIFAAACSAELTKIKFEAVNLSGNQWQYTYELTNLGLSSAIEEFTVWFDPALYTNLAVTTDPSLSNLWDEIILQPDTVLNDSGAYDALALASNPGIGIGSSIEGFSVSFTWLGTGTPGSQYYEIIEPQTFQPLTSGYTIPEPVTALLLTAGLFLLKRK